MKKIFLGIMFVMFGSMCGYCESFAEEKVPDLYIKAVNPGYAIDGVNNVGEMIELARKSSDEPVLLTGFSLSYTNSSGKKIVLLEFPENSWMTGENILLRLASSPGNELAAMNYTKTLALKAGPLELMKGEEVIDAVCWNGKDGCYKDFKADKPTTLVRDLETGEFSHKEDYVPEHKAENYRAEAVEEIKSLEPSVCGGAEFSEILSFYNDTQAEQFVEFYNAMAEQVVLDGCKIKYKNKFYDLSGVIKPGEYFARYLDDFAIAKNPSSSNVLELVDQNGDVVDKLEYFNGQIKGASYIFVGYDGEGKEIWKTTYVPTPGEANNYQEFKTCEEGKVLNAATGNCVKVTAVTEKVCKSGQYLNPLTGRCKTIEKEKAKTCKEGYEYNAETGRCRKKQENNGADYSLKVEEYDENESFIALYAVLAAVGVGVGYLIYEFRQEILRLFHKVCRRSR